MQAKAPVAILSGAVRAGKSRPLVESALQDALRYPKGRFAIVRETRSSLRETTLRSFLVDANGWNSVDDPSGSYGLIRDWRKSEYKATLQNGSEILFFGLDKAAGSDFSTKIGSMELSRIYIDEAIEVGRSNLRMLRTRLSYQPNGCTPQIKIATNPGNPQHWIYQDFIKPIIGARSIEDLDYLEKDNIFVGFMRTLENPYLSSEYIAEMVAMEGTPFYKRMVLGLWIAYLGMIYDCFDEAVHVVDEVPEVSHGAFNIRSIDFGGSNPFVCQWWRYFPIDHPKYPHHLYNYREIYYSNISAGDFAEMIKKHQPVDEEIEYSISDHDVSDRLTLRKAGIPTRNAKKDIKLGLEEVYKRFKHATIYLKRGAIVERDPSLIEEEGRIKRTRPQTTLEEIPSYEWALTSNEIAKDEPVKKDDHGCDAMRYAAMSVWRGFVREPEQKKENRAKDLMNVKDIPPELVDDIKKVTRKRKTNWLGA